MKINFSAVIALIIAAVAGCGNEIPPLHPLILEFPIIDCRVDPSPWCIGYKGCPELGIRNIYFNVSSPDSSVDTTFWCTMSVPKGTIEIYYEPGHETYTINANYTRDNITTNLSSGPFAEDQTKTPWTLQIH